MRRKVSAAISTGIAILVIGFIPSTSLSFPEAKVGNVQRPSHKKLSQKRSNVAPKMLLEAQQQLVALGYWIGEADGKWGEASRHGLTAFQKVEGLPRTGKLTPALLKALLAANRPHPRERGPAHIEVDLTRQVLFVVDDNGTVSRVLPVSSGNGKLFTVDGYTQPAVTPVGRFRVYRKLDGWRKSKLGLLYYPNYIVGGIAIHGNPAVPPQAQSHGCIRIPMFASVEFSDITPVGTPVIIYGEGPPRQSLPPPE